jgi:hypothetical protein
MLSRMRLLHIRLRNLLHHKVGIDINFLAQRSTSNAPLSGDGKHADRRLSVDKGVDAFGDVGEGQFVCGLQSVSM